MSARASPLRRPPLFSLSGNENRFNKFLINENSTATISGIAIHSVDLKAKKTDKSLSNSSEVLLGTIKLQNVLINRLEKENSMLKLRLHKFCDDNGSASFLSPTKNNNKHEIPNSSASNKPPPALVTPKKRRLDKEVLNNAQSDEIYSSEIVTTPPRSHRTTDTTPLRTTPNTPNSKLFSPNFETPNRPTFSNHNVKSNKSTIHTEADTSGEDTSAHPQNVDGLQKSLDAVSAKLKSLEDHLQRIEIHSANDKQPSPPSAPVDTNDYSQRDKEPFNNFTSSSSASLFFGSPKESNSSSSFTETVAIAKAISLKTLFKDKIYIDPKYSNPSSIRNKLEEYHNNNNIDYLSQDSSTMMISSSSSHPRGTSHTSPLSPLGDQGLSPSSKTGPIVSLMDLSLLQTKLSSWKDKYSNISSNTKASSSSLVPKPKLVEL